MECGSGNAEFGIRTGQGTKLRLCRCRIDSLSGVDMRCGDFKESYIKDEEIFQSVFVKFWLTVFFIFLILIPLVADAYVLYIANLIGFAIIGAVGLNILTGFTGQISLGHAAFVGVGGYTAAILMTKLNFSFWLALPCAGVVARRRQGEWRVGC